MFSALEYFYYFLRVESISSVLLLDLLLLSLLVGYYVISSIGSYDFIYLENTGSNSIKSASALTNPLVLTPPNIINFEP